ncbi:MAG: hypothetical protein EOP06_31820 [Proteobacteria bacterium]|nr:MAG: hypothetical protein EOP06_31820 [Pseudomonadota bacterium]
MTTASPGNGIQKSVFDGQVALFLDSRVPNQFKRDKPNSMMFDGFLGVSDAYGTGIDLLLNDNLAAQFLDPCLESIEMGKPEVLNGKTLQNVVLTVHTSSTQESYTLSIDTQDWVLYRTVSINQSFTMSSTTTFTQTYSQVKFDEELPEKLFSTIAPKGYKAVDFLGDPNQPYEYD